MSASRAVQAREGAVVRLSVVRRVVALAAAAVVGAGLVAGCGSKPDGSDADPSPSGSWAPRVQQPDLSKPLHEETYQVPGSDQDTVTVGLLGLESDGQLQVLKLVLTPHFASASKNVRLSDMLALGYGDFTPELVDRKNQKVYHVVAKLATGASAETPDETPMYVYAVFAAPQGDNKDFEVHVNDEWQPFLKATSVEDGGE